MNLNNVVVTGEVVFEVTKELNIGMLDWSYYLGVFGSGIEKMKNNPDQPIDHVRSFLLRYIARTYGKAQRFSTTSYQPLAPRGKSGRAQSFELLRQMIDVYQEHRYGIYLEGAKLNFTSTAHVGIVLGRNYLSARKYLLGETEMTTSAFRWMDIILSRLESSPFRGAPLKSLEAGNISDPELNLIEEIITEEASAHNVEASILLRRGW